VGEEEEGKKRKIWKCQLTPSSPLSLSSLPLCRLDLETDFRKNQDLDEKLLVDVEGVARILKQSLGDLKDRLEVELECMELQDSSEEEIEVN
jgi:hypothetical protein